MLSLFSRVQLCVILWTPLLDPSIHGDSLGKNTGVGCHAFLQGIFQMQGLKPYDKVIFSASKFFPILHEGIKYISVLYC